MFINKITNVKNMGSYYIEFSNTVLQEQDGEKGLSHLVEHCMCESAKILETKFHENGITWNAYTSDNRVCYFMSGLAKSVKKFIPEFTERILKYEITKDVFEREKKVVISEYLMYYNDNTDRFMNNWFRKHYNYTGELGLLTDLQNITYENFMKFKNRVFVKPDNIYFIHSKNILDSSLDNIEYNKDNKNIKCFDYNDSYNIYPIEYYNTGINSQRILMFGYDIICKNNEEFNKFHALSSLFNYFMCSGLSSYLYKEIREKYACVYSIYPFGQIFPDKTHMFFGYMFETEDKNVELLIKVINKCMKKLMKSIKLRKFNSIYKSFNVKYKIQSNTDYDSFSYFCDNDVRTAIDYIMNKKISFEDFKEFAYNFSTHYKLYNDENYILKNEKDN